MSKKLEDTWMQEFGKINALWVHDKNPNRPYARLTSGKISNGFFNATKVIFNPHLMQYAVMDLLGRRNELELEEPNLFVGSAMGAITLASEAAAQLHDIVLEPVYACWTTPSPDKTRMDIGRFESLIPKQARAFIIEDVMTTGGTTLKTIAELERIGVHISPAIFVLVNRSGMSHLDGRPIISLIDVEMPIWNEGENPFTEDGKELVPPVRPKDNWDILTQEM